MVDNSAVKFGGVCGILAGVSTLVAGILYFLLPPEQRLGVPGAQLLPSFAQNPTILVLENLVLGLVGIFGLGFVPAIAEVTSPGQSGWKRWVNTLALVGYAVSAVTGFLIVARLPVIARAYMAGDPSTQAALAAVWRMTLDPFGLWGYGLVGLWVIVTSAAALRVAPLPSTLGYLGIVAGILLWIVPVAFLLSIPSLFLVAAAAAGLANAVWYIWAGVALRQGQATAAL